MPTLDSTAKAQLDTLRFSIAWFIFLDIQGDPVRVTTYGADVTPASTGDSDLDGNTFSSVRADVLDVGDVAYSDNGSDTVTVTLSGIASINTVLLNDIGDKTKWQGRLVRMWFRLYDESGTEQGAYVPYYTGYASSVSIVPSPTTQSIQLEVENYLAAFNQASNRSYLNQKDYDSADTSAAATISAANGASNQRPSNSTGGGGGGGGGRGGFNVVLQ